MADYDNSRYTYTQVLAGTGWEQSTMEMAPPMVLSIKQMQPITQKHNPMYIKTSAPSVL